MRCPSLNHDNSCPMCNAYLIIKFAAGGQSVGHRYINCHKCRFFHAFPHRDAPPAFAASEGFICSNTLINHALVSPSRLWKKNLMPSLSTISRSMRPRLSVTIPTTHSLGVTSTTTSSTRTSLTPFGSSSRASTPATSATSESFNNLPAPIPPLTLDLRQKFPIGLYVAEVVAGMRSMDSEELKILSMADSFQHVFQRPYVKQTYQDAVKRWRLASETMPELCERGLNAGITPLSLWTNWQKAVPLRS
ncbi:hypothetical protein B0H13DRAFT_2372944 [Mycena leptocephala]|nr:hypothetical protein B0H13DRAFT_2372944 [Mycena leptocephala]